jgi:hypothetical protein
LVDFAWLRTRFCKQFLQGVIGVVDDTTTGTCTRSRSGSYGVPLSSCGEMTTAVTPTAPGRLSTITDWPSIVVVFGAINLAIESLGQQAVKGSMTGMGRFDNCCCAGEGGAPSGAMKGRKKRATAKMRSMMGVRLFRYSVFLRRKSLSRRVVGIVV